MSSIVSSIIQTDSPQRVGRHIVEHHTDSTGKIHTRSYRAAVGDDVEASMLAYVPTLNANLADIEVTLAIDLVRAGSDPTTITFNEQTNLVGRRRVIKKLLRGSPEDVMLIAGTLLALNNGQLGNLINITGAKLTRIRAVLTLASDIKTDYESIQQDPDLQDDKT